MARRSTIEFEVLSPDLVDEVQRVLPVLTSGGQVTVTLSSELAHLVAKFLRATAEQGAVAFRSVSPQITPQQVSEILGTELVP